MDLSKFLTYWSLTFAIMIIWVFSIAVALADVKNEFLDKLRKWGRSTMNGTKTVGIIVLGLYFVFVWYMLRLTTTPEIRWTRTVYVFSGVEAIAFAAAGFFFGREVHRERAQQAERRANQAETRAETASVDAQKGRDLAEFVRSAHRGHAAKSQAYGIMGPGQVQQLTQVDLKQLAEVADSLFPP